MATTDPTLGGASGPLPPNSTSASSTTKSSLPDTVNLIPNFLTKFLDNADTSIYKGSQWLVTFSDLNDLIPAMKKAVSYNPAGPWDFEGNSAELTKSSLHEHNCLFAQAISLPGESFQPTVAGNISSGAFVRPYVGSGRNAFPLLRMSFLETVLSFTDNVLRPWVLATQTFGMIAPQNDDENYRITLECWKLTPQAKEGSRAPTITMKMTFHDVCCVSIGDEEYNYNPMTAPMLRDAQFAYSSYSVNRLPGG